jgi:GT2 family glycosyltransferase
MEVVVVRSKEEIGSAINLNVEGVKKFGASILIHGWIVDPHEKLTSIVVRSPFTGNTVDLVDQMLKFSRPDVSAAFGGRINDVRTHYGFAIVLHPSNRHEVNDEIDDISEFGIAFLTSYGVAYSEKIKIETIFDMANELPLILGIVSDGSSVTGERCEKFYIPIFGEMIRFNEKYNELFDARFDKNGADEEILVSIIIPLYGSTRFENIQIPALSLLANKNWEIIFALDDPRVFDEVKKNIKRLTGMYSVPVRMVAPDKNLGFSGINNFAAKKSKGKYILFLNSDCFISSSNGIEKAISWLESSVDHGAVGFRLKYPDDTIQHDGMEISMWNDNAGFLLNEHPRRGLPSNLIKDEIKNDKSCMLTAACLLMSRSMFNKINGFDKIYYRGDFEDSDICLKILKNNKKLGIIRNENIYHLERQTISEQDGGIRQIITLVNSYLYTKKWSKFVSNGLVGLEVIK